MEKRGVGPSQGLCLHCTVQRNAKVLGVGFESEAQDRARL